MKILKRVVTALATAGAVVAALVLLKTRAGGDTAVRVVIPLMMALALAAQLEFSQMVRRAKYEVMLLPGLVAGLVYLVGRYYLGTSFLIPIVFALALVALFSKSARPIEQLSVTLFGFFYAPWLFARFIDVAQCHGVYMLLYVIAIVKFSDMGGFAFGLTIGRHKLCPTISPNKTWEGLFGSCFAAVLMSVLLRPLTGHAPVTAVLFGLAAAVVGTLGDLVESRLKRECGVKDSATFMPAGLGGFLDMFDSLLFAAALLGPFL